MRNQRGPQRAEKRPGPRSAQRGRVARRERRNPEGGAARATGRGGEHGRGRVRNRARTEQQREACEGNQGRMRTRGGEGGSEWTEGDEWEIAPDGTEGTRAHDTHGRGATTHGRTAEVPGTTAMGSMRGTGSESSAMDESSDARRVGQNAAEEEHEEGSREEEQREAAATPQREGGEEREQTDTAQQPTAADSVEARHSPGVNVNRPKRGRDSRCTTR